MTLRLLSGIFLILLSLGCSACGAPTGSGAPPPSTDSLVVQEVPDDHGATPWLSKFVMAFGVPVYGAPGVSDEKLLHAATVMAEYLDNDEDGLADDLSVVESMVENNAALVMFPSADDLDSSGIFESPWIDQIWGQDLAEDETAVPGRFDATLEEVLHLINTAGHAQVYPDRLGMEGSTDLTEAMDLARGGHFTSVPSNYPEEAWYHYDDTTCDYNCMATEYLYWGLTSLLGAQSGRCNEIAVEWELCTAEGVESGDPSLHALLTDPLLKLPTVLPDGVYSTP
jgi:hypothetical protein